MKKISAIAACAALTLVLAACAGCDDGHPEEGLAPAPQQSQQTPSADAGGAVGPLHEHVWVADYELETTDAVAETIHHEAVVEEVTEDRTVCNVCLEPIDGQVEAHQAATGHTGVSEGVPVTVERTVSEAWDEVVEKAPASSALVSRTETCTQCGEQRPIEEKIVDASAPVESPTEH